MKQKYPLAAKITGIICSFFIFQGVRKTLRIVFFQIEKISMKFPNQQLVAFVQICIFHRKKILETKYPILEYRAN